MRRLSQGRVLLRLFELYKETKIFLGKINFSLEAFLFDDTWLCKLAFLADIFSRLNELNTSLRGFYRNVFIPTNKTDAFEKKLALWNILVKKEDKTMFLILNGYVSSVDINHKKVLNIVSQHLIAYQFRSLFSSSRRSST